MLEEIFINYDPSFFQRIDGSLQVDSIPINKLRVVRTVYPEAKIEDGDTSLILRPSKPHIPLLFVDKSTI
ncbi:MAG: hypothetical protein BGO67_00565 [Alphaproteobacteria bacterium 41-28]|nr:MAG: hypothetical protein BGO67_00565 [Alphaproteobacteria bacterium 41-28]